MAPPDPRRLLLVSHRPLAYEGPGTVRWRYLIDHLPRHGWTVSTLTARTNPTSDELSDDPRVARLSSARARVMGQVGRVARPAANRVLGVQPEAFPLSMTWSLTARRALRDRVARERPDAVVATSPPVAALFATGGALAGSGVPLVADMRDPWAGHPAYDAGGTLLTRLEGRALRPFDAVVAVTAGMVERFARLHPELDGRLHLIPNGFDPELLDRRDERPERRPGDRVTLVHPGILYGERSIDDLLRAIDAAGLGHRLRLSLIGNMNATNEQALRALPQGLELDVAGPRPWAETMDRVVAADIVVVIVPASMGDDVAWPVKLLEALALGKPVLAITSGGETEALLRRLGRDSGCARIGDVPSVAQALERLLDDPPPPLPVADLRQWDRAANAEAYARLLDGLVR